MLIRFRSATPLLCLTALICLAAAAPVQAQIYSWRDANGNLVLSNRKQAGATAVKSFAVPQTKENVRVTRYATAERGRAYDDLILEHSRSNGVRPDLVRAVVQVESAFNPNALSPKGAMGLMQLMPDTARQYAVADPYDPRANIEAGTRHLRSLMDRYPLNLALAAYNAGAAAVDRFGGIPPFAETRDYVARILRLTQ